jgi:2-polyprenyl-3-methyl-5-hydroxy-6-metoxy-1,4-benzoquinol methylase
MDAEDWNRRYADAELVWSAEPNVFVARHLADLPPGSALDLACGEGRNALWLAGRGWRVTAVDFSDVALSKGRRRAEELGIEIDWHCADVTTWQPPTAGRDLVLLAHRP